MESRRDCNCSSSSAKTRCWSRSVSIFIRSISKSTILIVAPTTYRSIIKNSAGVSVSRRYYNCSSSSAKTRDLSRSVSMFIRSISNLPDVIISPTTYRSIVKKSAGAVRSRRDCNSSSSSSKTRCGSRRVSMFIRSISKLSKVIHSPTTYSSIIKKSAGVVFSRSESYIGKYGAFLETWFVQLV